MNTSTQLAASWPPPSSLCFHPYLTCTLELHIHTCIYTHMLYILCILHSHITCMHIHTHTHTTESLGGKRMQWKTISCKDSTSVIFFFFTLLLFVYETTSLRNTPRIKVKARELRLLSGSLDLINLDKE